MKSKDEPQNHRMVTMVNQGKFNRLRARLMEEGDKGTTVTKWVRESIDKKLEEKV